MFDILAFIQIMHQLGSRAAANRSQYVNIPSHRPMRFQCQRGFTLIEIMVVVIIIGILVAIVAPNVLGNIDKAQITRAKSDMRGIESALKFYRLDNYAYPTSEQGLQALISKPNDPNIKNWRTGGYLERMPKDPWGNPYQYLSPGNNGEFDVYTLGRDGRPGGEGLDADIGNWELE
jgi:general secretion pathway protein G